jgi:hypothetical protein
MKFLVIARPTGHDHGLDSSPKSARRFAAELKKLQKGGAVEACYAFIAGGYAYVVSASDTRDLAVKVRHDPLFDAAHTEIIPVADAVDFLEGVAGFAEKTAKKK